VNKFLKIILLLFGFIFLVGLGFFLKGYFQPRKAGILIETTPTALVFIDSVQVGRTPYEATQKPSEISVKLVPESLAEPLASYETKVNLGAGIKTVIKREFGESDESSSGEIISFEKIGRDETSLAVVTTPDSAQVSIDGQNKGFAPIKVSQITQAEHQIAVSALGYRERTLTVKTVTGYKLAVIIKLAKSTELGSQPLQSPSGQATPEPKTLYVEILETPSGFLRVREEPNIASKELARVKPGDKFLLVEEDPKSGWFKIELGLPAQAGWISNQYAKKIEKASD